jgi:HEAT repeat protein
MKKTAFLLALVALPLQADLRSDILSRSGWVAYSIPATENTIVCSWDDTTSIRDGAFNVGGDQLHIQYEVTEGRITAVRLSSPTCPDRKAAHWLGAVDPRESRRLLISLVEGELSVAKKATTALAMHEDVEEDLIRIAKTHSSSKVRSNALFWVGQRAGEKAASVLREAVDADPDAEVKAKAVFGISQLPNDRSIPLLIELMTTHKSRAVRKKAAFWLGQKNDPRALEAFERVLLRP